MRNNPIIVHKYGGACLETPARIRAVASSLADLHSRGHRVVAIVSAMGRTTDELVKMAYQVMARILIAVNSICMLTTGERHRQAWSLMSMALSDLGVPAHLSFTGASRSRSNDRQIPFLRAHYRCATHSRARRTRSRTHRGFGGFQGVNPVTKEITTAGPGAAANTAVAMAGGAKKPSAVRLSKRSDGVCSADPRIVA